MINSFTNSFKTNSKTFNYSVQLLVNSLLRSIETPLDFFSTEKLEEKVK